MDFFYNSATTINIKLDKRKVSAVFCWKSNIFILNICTEAERYNSI